MAQKTSELRKAIEEYNSRKCLTPLFFQDAHKKKHEIPKGELKFNRSGTPNRYRLVLSILDMTAKYYSVDGDGKVETPPEANRSAIDIWRHAIALYPDMDIYRIMETIYRLCDKEEEEGALVFGQFCWMIKQSVFRNFRVRTTDMDFSCDEYDMAFGDWKVLHEPKKEKTNG
jgi:hypothetical protein